MRHVAPGLVLALALGSCRSATSARPVEPTPAAPRAASAPTARPPTALRWVLRSAEYRAALLQTYRAAIQAVEGEALRRPSGSWAVVLDADETVISNARYQLELAAEGAPHTPQRWAAWIARREARPLPGAAEFLARVRKLGGRIAIVTNRSQSECPETEAVFKAHELEFDAILCRPDGGPADKTARFGRLRRGEAAPGLPPLEIVAFLGDNIQDFPGGSQQLAARGDEAFGEFGTRFFVLPNPLYGSWEAEAH